MIFGSVNLDGNAVNTHRDSYLLSNLSVVSVRRPFFGAAVLLGCSFAGFSAAFGDLLYPVEIATIIGLSSAAIIAGYQTGQLKLLSRDLRGSELSGVIWGQYKSLNIIRSKIIQKISQHDLGGAS
ncbi:MAG: hypothetical protein COA52_20235 [Hyphomicrobiales bacterium]|nr:MAG: hypothetical protein COA52_20235 [Hyphomicrobiales bacterium]